MSCRYYNSLNIILLSTDSSTTCVCLSILYPSEKVFHLGVRPQPNNSFVLQVLSQHSFNFRPASFSIVPHPEDKFQSNPLGTSFCHIRPALVAIFDRPFDHTPKADHTLKIKKDNRVASLKAQFKRARVVSIHYPGVTRDDLFDGLLPFRLRGLNPPCTPV